MKHEFLKTILALSIPTVVTVSCGIGPNSSSTSAITPPERIEIGIAESFWLYENSTDAQKQWIPVQHSDLQFYPELMPTTGNDYFWVTDKSTKVMLVPDRFERHLEGKISRLEFANSLGHASITLNHTLFDGMEVGIDYTLIPTFEIKGKIDDKVSISFNMKMECFSIDPNSYEINILDSHSRPSNRTINLSRPNFELETYTLESQYTRSDYTEFKNRCDGLGGTDIASSFDFDIQALKVSNSLTVDFPGIFVKRTTRN